jgi:acetyltransferase-like isoleucine patch superfamily enzyme
MKKEEIKKNGGEVCVHKGSRIDPGVTLGYISPRSDVKKLLVIGDNARIRIGTVIYMGSRIGSHLETGHNVVIREENQIGNHFSIWNNSVVDYGCRIGNGVKVHCNVYIAQYTTIEDNVFLAPGVNIANDMHPGCPESKECMKGPTLKRNCKIGVNVTILPFLTIGEGTLVGSGSVVTSDLPAGVVAYGNPAKVHGKLEQLRCKTGRREKPYS